MLRLYVTRHGETLWNTQRRLQGHKDSELTTLGLTQASRLHDRLQDVTFNAIYASSSLRTVKTAEIIRGSRQIEIFKTDLLKEINMGEWEGELDDDIRLRYPEEHGNFWERPHMYRPFGGESFFDVMYRAENFIKQVLEKHNGQEVLLVTHGVMIKAIAAWIEGKEVKDLWTGPFLKPTSLSIFEYVDDSWRTIIYGDTLHYNNL